MRLKRQLKAYQQWKAHLVRTVEEYRSWLKQHGMAAPETGRRIDYCLETLKNDRLTIAFVAEFSRGKTELINAIFFADYGRRLLPSTPGRTTMCPTEIFYDDEVNAAYVRLLPIETRLRDSSLAELRQAPGEWVHYPLNLTSPRQMEETLRQVGETKRVPLEEAGRLGLHDDRLEFDCAAPPTHIEIPRWRHALISFPHPLLRQGLSILDTPGLNALGHEPELTLSMLPQAQAVLFVLAADTGVTRTDLRMWQHHIKGFQSSRQRGLTVVLNKIDTLWDELQDKARIQRAIERQRSACAAILGIGEDAVFPVSAQKGLLAKVRNDGALLEHSALPGLEAHLSHSILAARQEILRETIVDDLCHLLEDSRSRISARLGQIKKEKEELQALGSESTEIIIHLLGKSQDEKNRYLAGLKHFQIMRAKLGEQAGFLRDALDPEELDRRIARARASMLGSWTTPGLKAEMRSLFDDFRNRMRLAAKHGEEARKLIRATYSRFQQDHGLAAIQPKMFSIMQYRLELQRLMEEAEAFRNSAATLVMAKPFVVNRFFDLIVAKARDILVRAGEEADSRLAGALQPLAQQIRDHRDMLEQRLNDLRKISRSRDILKTRIADLEREHEAHRRQLASLHNIHSTLANSRPLTDEDIHRPRLVSSKKAS